MPALLAGPGGGLPAGPVSQFAASGGTFSNAGTPMLETALIALAPGFDFYFVRGPGHQLPQTGKKHFPARTPQPSCETLAVLSSLCWGRPALHRSPEGKLCPHLAASQRFARRRRWGTKSDTEYDHPGAQTEGVLKPSVIFSTDDLFLLLFCNVSCGALTPSRFRRVLGSPSPPARKAGSRAGAVSPRGHRFLGFLFILGRGHPAGTPGSPRLPHSCPPRPRRGSRRGAPRRGVNGITRHAYLPSPGIRGGSFSTSIALSSGIWKYPSEVFISLWRVVTSELLKYFHDLFPRCFFSWCYLKRGRKVNGAVKNRIVSFFKESVQFLLPTASRRAHQRSRSCSTRALARTAIPW